ncbi:MULTISPECIES: helix-turn-helix domain-containing protein [Vibrio]|uniref:Helix-turn-helix domain-containing protein n=1 Tax=Vibrio algicola TaxID=2662262 RepID=A0A5Q0TF58_9VIBR|nr:MULTISPECIES: helix-turn-helix domain-containing protein [Vibrio]MBD1575895.1 helix-turn-helix domain-containing protein [Vibrio sp. S11_S32]
MELSPVFAKRLYLALLVADIERPNVPKLIELTGWPRRTIQDVLKALPAIGIHLEFVQDGCRYNDGYYSVNDWGPFDCQKLHGWKNDIAHDLGFNH